MNTVLPVILCGGSGTRLWPLSRKSFPKQFLNLYGDQTLFQHTVRRITPNSLGSQFAVRPPFIVTGNSHRFTLTKQLKETGIEDATIFLESSPRNTAAALTMAALANENEDPIMVVLSSDQAITDVNHFRNAIKTACSQASTGAMVILGIPPLSPETGFGYVKTKQTNGNSDVFEVESFIEKPNLERAKQFLNEGGYFWNAGIFVMKASVWLSSLKMFRPDIKVASRQAYNSEGKNGDTISPYATKFDSIPSESIDYAVMEKCVEAKLPLKIVPLITGWNDLGSWKAVHDVMPKDSDNNVTQGDVHLVSTSNSLALATYKHVSVVGLNDVAVVETSDAVLVTSLSRSQEVKHAVANLIKENRPEADLHRKVNRPWGSYDSIDEEATFKVKRIIVNPGQSLSLQRHSRRAEHWIVVDGIAEVQCGENVVELHANQSIYIPKGEIHRLTNRHNVPMTLIEVQCGDYLGEDDIERLEDIYGRS